MPAFALENTRKPQRAIGLVWTRMLIPGETAVKHHSKLSGPLRAYGPHQLVRAARSNEIDRPAVAEQRIDPKKPRQSGFPVIKTKKF